MKHQNQATAVAIAITGYTNAFLTPAKPQWVTIAAWIALGAIATIWLIRVRKERKQADA
ncbi:hypothetical protein [Mobiluncus porci]|uniref:hypothetical protein n=1 Tax=Mobiluncus porci TaxID=2652278 RepID=UPI0012B25605|nr:hypothetical protein [Mobiluncus porci]